MTNFSGVPAITRSRSHFRPIARVLGFKTNSPCSSVQRAHRQSARANGMSERDVTTAPAINPRLRNHFLGQPKGSDDHLDFVSHTIVKKRTNGTIHNTTGENGLIARSSFPLDKTRPFDFSRCIEFFFKTHHERKIINIPITWCAHDRRKNNGISVPHRTTVQLPAAQYDRFPRSTLVHPTRWTNVSHLT